MPAFRLLMFLSLVAMFGCQQAIDDGAPATEAPVTQSTRVAMKQLQLPVDETKDDADAQPTEAGAEEPRYRLVVSFNSFASGPDPAASALFARILANQQESLGRKLTSVDHAWGHEGEYSKCFMLDELNTDEQRSFVEAVRSGLQTDRAYFQENVSCPATFNPMR